MAMIGNPESAIHVEFLLRSLFIDSAYHQIMRRYSVFVKQIMMIMHIEINDNWC